MARLGGHEAQNQLIDFERVYREHRASIRGYLFGMTRNEHLAEDLTQETFTKAYASLGSFRGDSSAATWLYRIATNAAYDAFRGGC